MKQIGLVGILNITPDSFSQDGHFDAVAAAVAHAKAMFAEGAELVDVGAESTNPRSQAINVEEEWRRLQPILAELVPAYPERISLDSYHPETIERAVQQLGPHFIANDVTGMNDPAMRQVVAQYHLRCIVSHLPARFGTDIHAAHQDAALDNETVVRDELLTRRAELMQLGVPKDAIILDPGIGFGKTMPLNQRLLRFAALVPNSPVMIGYSRKRFLGEHRFDLAPNLAAGDKAMAAGARYIRVHDVRAHYEHFFGKGTNII